MKYECEVIKDLLPLYQDDTASDRSTAVVNEHLAECSSCKAYLDKMKHSFNETNTTPEITETGDYKKLAKKLRFRKAFICTGLAIFLCLTCSIAYAYVDGVRFSAQQAAVSSHYIDENSILLGEAEIGSYKVFFYENDDKYRTIITENFYSIWRLNRNSSWANKSEDALKMVGWCSMTDNENGKGLTAIPVQSYDENVAYIEMGPEGNRIIKDAVYGELIVFAWEYSVKWNDLNAIAYSADNEPLYKLGYEKVGGMIKTDELRWLTIE